MFIVNASLLVLSILYSLVWLRWRTSTQQQPFSGANWLLDFFDAKHVATTMRTLLKPRRHHGKLHLWLLLLAMSLYTFQRDEKPKSQMYTSLIFKWNVTDFSNFKTFQSSLFVVGQFGISRDLEPLCPRVNCRLILPDPYYDGLSPKDTSSERRNLLSRRTFTPC
jgi:PCFT/HCP family folate transporter-like MFS transporter 1/3